MKKALLIVTLMCYYVGFSQIDKEQLALKVSKIEEVVGILFRG